MTILYLFSCVNTKSYNNIKYLYREVEISKVAVDIRTWQALIETALNWLPKWIRAFQWKCWRIHQSQTLCIAVGLYLWEGVGAVAISPWHGEAWRRPTSYKTTSPLSFSCRLIPVLSPTCQCSEVSPSPFSCYNASVNLLEYILLFQNPLQS